MKQKYNHWLPKLIKVNAIVLFQIIYYAIPEDKVTKRLKNHEREHVKQQKEEGSIIFLLKYILEFIINLFKYKSFNKAYWYISYEIKARKEK